MDVILVPGLWLDADSWEGVTPALEAAGHRVRVVPLPGLGVPAPTSSDVGMQDWVESVVAEVDAAGAPVALVGHSGGGNAVWGAVSARPNGVARAVLVDTVPPPGGSVSEFEVVDGVIPFPGWDSFDDPEVYDLDAPTRERWAARAKTIPERTPTDEIVLADDGRFGVPTTLLMGPYDEPEFRETIQQWGPYAAEFGAIRDSSVVKLDSGHWPQFSKPDALAAAILAAIDG